MVVRLELAPRLEQMVALRLPELILVKPFLPLPLLLTI